MGNDKVHNIASRQALFWFPLAALLNAFSMTALLVILGVAGYPELAVSIGLVQGATLATFYVFSANARNLILADSGEMAASRLLQMRLLLLLPLAGIAYFLSVAIGEVAAPLALVLILRRASEWIGELGLSQHERLDQQSFAQRAVFGEAVGFLLCLVLSMGFGADLASSAIPWAFAPLISVFRARLSLRASRLFTIHSVFPHVGSTAIIGISVYVFRISVALLAGKIVAGELFTAFAIGGIIPTIFGQALAPTLLRRFGPSVMQSGWLAAFPAAMLAVAGGVVMLAIAEPAWLVDAGRSSTFWLATGLSIAGGAIMMVAVLLRAHLIHSDDKEVFGPDMLANILLVASTPLIYFTLGAKSLAGLYMLSACLNLVYMWGAAARKRIDGPCLRRILLALGLLLVAPVFFQLEGNLFRDPAMLFDTGGQLLSLPIPVSVLALFGGIAILGNYTAAKRSLAVVFFTMLLFVASVLRIEGGYSAQEGGKLVLLAQFLFPIFGLVLGEMFGAVARGPIFERAALSLLLLILPAQLAATWLAGHTDARPLVFIFSIYQHLQYFPAIVAALATMASLALWSRSGSMRIAIGFMIPIALLHLVASASINAIAGAATGMAALMIFHWRDARFRWHLSAALAAALLAAAAYVALFNTDNSAGYRHSEPRVAEASAASWSVSAADGSSRAEQWRVFADGIVASPGAFLFGHAVRPDRNLHPNAHNYWLDAVYSFGMLAILPLIALLAMTARLVWKQRSRVLSDPVLLGTTMAAGYLALVESMFNIGMRQPYPGIITFFILGLLISRLGSGKTSPVRVES
jgi:hypothetical protein